MAALISAGAVILAAFLSAGATIWASRIARDVRQIRISVNGRLDALLTELRALEIEEGITDPSEIVHKHNHDGKHNGTPSN